MLDGHLGRAIEVDLCDPCQSLWFDGKENLQLTPGSILELFRAIGEHVGRPALRDGELVKCPRCKAGLRRTKDMQRNTRFEYFRCPNDHGRLTAFFDFLKEKDFIRPLTPQQIGELRRNIKIVNCSNCGGPVDLAKGSECAHCGSPLSILDLSQAEKLVAQLQKAEAHDRGPIDPALPLELLRARRDVEASFPQERGAGWSADLVDAGIQAVASWLKRNA